MSTFAQLTAKPDVGVVYLLDISTDDFATTSYRWATHHILVGANQYEGRISDLGSMTRDLGATSSLTGASIELTFDNTDAGIDWLIDRATFVSTTMKAAFRLTALVYDPLNTTDTATQVLGTFSLLDNPRRDSGTVKVHLVDDVVGRCMSLAPPPSLNDWRASGDGAMPPAVSYGSGSVISPGVDFSKPLPLWFGSGPFQALTVAPINGVVVCCAVASTRVGAPTAYVMVYDRDGNLIPSTGFTAGAGAGTGLIRSGDITKNGRTYHILYFVVSAFYKGPYMVVGSPWSQIDNIVRNTAAGGFYGAMSAVVHPATIVQELLTHYISDTSGLTVDGASFDLVRSLSPQLLGCGELSTSQQFGIPWKALSLGEVQQAIQGLSLAGRFDTVISGNGTAYAKTRALDFASITATATSIDETLMKDVRDYQPSIGERNALVTRYIPTYRGERQAPTVDYATEQSIGRVLEQTIDLSWLAPAIAGYGVISSGDAGSAEAADQGRAAVIRWGSSAFDPLKGRPMLSFKTTLSAASLNIGDFVSLSWTRGAQHTAYATSIWRVEGLTLLPLDGMVELKVLWCDEYNSGVSKPFLLDDPDSYAKRAVGTYGGGGRTITVTQGSNVVLFSSGDLTADGVVAGDILVVQDPTEAATSFKRNRALLVTSEFGVSDATHLTFSTLHCSVDFVATTAGIDAWTIYRGALNYPTALSDPTNYPNGSAMYGKISDSLQAGKFSDGTTVANTLQDG